MNKPPPPPHIELAPSKEVNQLLYVVFGTEEGSKQTYVFLGPPVPDELAQQISTIVFGPIVPIDALPNILGMNDNAH
jgi:hypothetical protein